VGDRHPVVDEASARLAWDTGTGPPMHREATRMGEPKLYERYQRRAAIDLFGSESRARSLCDGQWVIFPDVVLGFAGVGEPPRASHFRNAGEFCWVADKPYRVGNDKLAKIVPPEIVAGHPVQRAIHLFVRNWE